MNAFDSSIISLLNDFAGHWRTFDEVMARALELDREFQAAFATTTLPDKPDTERANRFLIAARRRRA